MIKSAKRLNTKETWVIVLYALALAGLLFCGLHGSISANSIPPRAPKTYPLYTDLLDKPKRRTTYQAPAIHRVHKQITQPKQTQVKSTVKPVHVRHHRHHLRLASEQQAATPNSAIKQPAVKPMVHRHRYHLNHHLKKVAKPAQQSKASTTQTRAQSTVSVRPHFKKWFRDGLNDDELAARGWISYHESGDNWKIVSYGGRCIGYFQLDPNYLGYKNGQINLGHHHQVKVADMYVKNRYGDWISAKQFWQTHHWY